MNKETLMFHRFHRVFPVVCSSVFATATLLVSNPVGMYVSVVQAVCMYSG